MSLRRGEQPSRDPADADIVDVIESLVGIDLVARRMLKKWVSGGMRPFSPNSVHAAIRGANSHFVVSGCSCADASADNRASAAAAFRKRSLMVAFLRLVKCTDIKPSCPCPASTSSHLTYQENRLRRAAAQRLLRRDKCFWPGAGLGHLLPSCSLVQHVWFTPKTEMRASCLHCGEEVAGFGRCRDLHRDDQ